MITGVLIPLLVGLVLGLAAGVLIGIQVGAFLMWCHYRSQRAKDQEPPTLAIEPEGESS